MNPIYLDHNATTPPHPEVIEAMLPMFEEHFGNPSSAHAQGRAARVRVDQARESTAELINAHPGEIIFTSGGTESDNLAIFGVGLALKDKGKHIITSKVEHPAIINSCRQLTELGYQVDYAGVDKFGRVDPAEIKSLITGKTLLITIQHANSEVGTLQPIEQIGEIAREHGVLFHTDAVQSVGKIEVDVKNLPVDLLSLSGHKMNGPKGVGGLYIRKGTPQLFPMISGGEQEKKRRGGTENVPGIVGLGKAAEIAKKSLEAGKLQLEEMRNHLYNLLREDRMEVFGHPEFRLPNTLNLSFEGVDGQTLMIGLDIEGISVSTGTACSSGSVLPSHVLSAMKVAPEKMSGMIRISLGKSNTMDEITRSADILKKIVAGAREKAAAISR